MGCLPRSFVFVPLHLLPSFILWKLTHRRRKNHRVDTSRKMSDDEQKYEFGIDSDDDEDYFIEDTARIPKQKRQDDDEQYSFF